MTHSCAMVAIVNKKTDFLIIAFTLAHFQ